MSAHLHEDIFQSPPMSPEEIATASPAELTESSPPLPVDTEEFFTTEEFITSVNQTIEGVRKTNKDQPDSETSVAWDVAAFAAIAGNAAVPLIMPENRLTTALWWTSMIVAGVYTARDLHHLKAHAFSAGNYNIQSLHGNKPTAKTNKGDVVVMVHPPAYDDELKTVAYDSQRLTVLDALSKTDADGFVLPLSDDRSASSTHPDALPLKDIFNSLKGYDIKLKYAEDAKGLLLTRPELQEIVRQEQRLTLRDLLRSRVSALYPSAVSLSRQSVPPEGAAATAATQYAEWDKKRRLTQLERLIETEWQASNDSVMRYRESTLPDKQSLTTGKPDVKGYQPGDQSTVGDYAVVYDKTQLTATVRDGYIGFRDSQQMVMDKRAISSLAALDEKPDEVAVADIRAGLEAGTYSRIELLSLAWQAEQLAADPPLLAAVEPTQELHVREHICTGTMSETFRIDKAGIKSLARRAGFVALLATTAVYLPDVIGTLKPNTSGPHVSDMPSMQVEAHGDISIEGYYSQDAFYAIDSYTMQWYPEQPINDTAEVLSYPEQPEGLTDYIEAQQILPGNGGLLPLSIKQDTRLVAVQVKSEDGEVIAAEVIKSQDGVHLARISPIASDVQLTYYLAPADGEGGIDPANSLQLVGLFGANSNQSLRQNIPPEVVAEAIRQRAGYDSGAKTEATVGNANAGNYADRVLLGRDAYVNCVSAANVVALSQIVAHPAEPAALVSGYNISDSEERGEEYAAEMHAWVATEPNPVIDGTPYLDEGQTLADVGLSSASQAELEDSWGEAARPFSPPNNQSFPWKPLTVVGGLTLGGVVLSRRKQLGLYAGLAVDLALNKVRATLPLTEVTPAAFRNILAQEAYADPDGKAPVLGGRFDELRRQIFNYEGVTEASIPDVALQNVLQKNSPIVKALLTPAERRVARSYAASIMRKRQHQALKTARQERKRGNFKPRLTG